MSLGQRLLAKHVRPRGARAALARKLGVSRSLVTQWASGARAPSAKNQRLLEKASDGAIPGESWD